MFRLVIKSFGWIFHHFALFFFILLLLVVGQEIYSVASYWEEATSEPTTENPIHLLSQEIQGSTPSSDQSAMCSNKESDLVQQRAKLRSEVNALRQEYGELYFYQIDEKLRREIKIRKIDSELQLIDQAIPYLQRCQAIASHEDTRLKCEELNQRCLRKIRQCRSLESLAPEECDTLERFIPPWPGICSSQSNNVKACHEAQFSICSRRSSVCSLLEGSSGEVLGPFEYYLETARTENSVITFLDGMTRATDEFIGQSVKAFFILVTIVFSPLLVNGIIFFGVAKLVERTYRVRLNNSSSMPLREVCAPKHLIEVELDSSRELLVKPEFIRSVPDNLTANTRALLNYSIPITSLASGLYMLTRFRTKEDSESVAVKLSESSGTETKLSIIELDEFDEIALSPRHIVGIVQDKDKPLQIHSTWLLSKPSAWLAGQLRVLVLKGPAKIILQGTRGIFVQKVTPSTPCSCEGVIGYSANLASESSRTETFWAFHRNKRELLKHRFSEADGVVLQEIHPQRKQVNISGWSFQRLGDVILNVFGI